MEQENKAQKEQDVRAMVMASVKKFRTSPKNSFIDSLVTELCERLKIYEIEKILKDLHRHKDLFPTMAYFESEIKSIERGRYLRKTNGTTSYLVHQRYVKSLPNMKTLAETLFMMIKKNNTTSPAFHKIKARLALTEEQLWEAYEQWTQGKVHPCVEIEKEIDVKKLFGV